MIKEEKFNNFVFQEQTSYYVYDSEENVEKGKWFYSTSSKESFEKLKEQIKSKFDTYTQNVYPKLLSNLWKIITKQRI